jgi:putative transposase
MPRPKQTIQLSDDELRSLTTLLSSGTTNARTQTRARVLDLLHRNYERKEIAALLRAAVSTVSNIKRRYLTAGFQAALYDKPRSGKPPQISGEERAAITALACSQAPAGHARWTLRLLADKAVESNLCESVSYKTVGEILKKTSFNRT